MHACREEEQQSREQASGATATAGAVTCSVCGRVSGDLKRHKCLQERQKPVESTRVLSSVHRVRGGSRVLEA